MAYQNLKHDATLHKRGWCQAALVHTFTFLHFTICRQQSPSHCTHFPIALFIFIRSVRRFTSVDPLCRPPDMLLSSPSARRVQAGGGRWAAGGRRRAAGGGRWLPRPQRCIKGAGVGRRSPAHCATCLDGSVYRPPPPPPPPPPEHAPLAPDGCGVNTDVQPARAPVCGALDGSCLTGTRHVDRAGRPAVAVTPATGTSRLIPQTTKLK